MDVRQGPAGLHKLLRPPRWRHSHRAPSRGNWDSSAERPYRVSPTTRSPRPVPCFIWRSAGRHSGPDGAAGGSGLSRTGLYPRLSPAPTLAPTALGVHSQGSAGPEACLTFPPRNPALEADPRGLCESTARGGGRDAAAGLTPAAGQLAGERAEPGALRRGASAGRAAPLAARVGREAGGGRRGQGGRMTRGAGQWGARPRPSLLRAFAAPAVSREPRGVSAQRAAAAAATRGPAGE